MRKIYYLALLLFVCISASSQSQNNMSYQAVIRNSSNNLITNQAVGMRISILQGSAVGTEVYVETQNPISNINGLVTLEIGNGTPTLGTYNGINWANGPYFVKTETDPTGGNSYTVVGVSQLMSVPYALYALNSGSSIAGPMGPQGPAGLNGVDGATGPIGPQGPAGVNGLDGATGPMGPQGPAGNDGLDGATGPMGPQGPAGINGLDGATGPMGPQGPAGINGLDGATGPMGPQGPAGLNGVDGATGPMGPQGPAGVNGLDGATGPMGPQGPAGINGLDGATGPMGPQGPAGINGLDGATGPMGPQGPAGNDGLDGATGPMGPQGPMGLSGVPTAFTFLSKTTNYTITSSDILNNVYLKNTSNSLITITLPSASIAGSGKMIYITSTSTSLYQSINVLSNGVDTIYGFYSNTTGTMNISTMTSSNIGWIQLVSDGTSWNILGMYW